MYYNFVLILIFAQFFLGCSGGGKALKPASHANCETTVEATLYSYAEWFGDYPAIVVRDGDNERTYTGKLISVEDNGIRFDPKSKGLFVDKPERLYTYDEVLFAIDENYKTVHGSPPAALNMTLELTPEVIGKPVELTLRSGLKTSACISPGRYFVTNIKFWNSHKYREKCVSLPQMFLDIKPERINYLGEFYLDDNSVEQTDNFLQLSYKVSLNSLPVASSRPVLLGNGRGRAGIGVGSKIYSRSNKGTHLIDIKYDDILQNSNKHYTLLQFVQ